MVINGKRIAVPYTQHQLDHADRHERVEHEREGMEVEMILIGAVPPRPRDCALARALVGAAAIGTACRVVVALVAITGRAHDH